MGPFIKTLFGNARNVAIVAAILVLEVALLRSGLQREAVLLVPASTIAGIAWLATQ